MPQSLQKRVVSLAHERHQGVVKTKERLRSKVWWPGMDREAERRCAKCYGCQLVTKNVPPPPLKPTSMPQRPWKELALDLLGPLPFGDSLLVLVDYYSKWMLSEPQPARSLFSDSTLSLQGLGYLIKAMRTDNGSKLVSKEMKDSLSELGKEHWYTTPLWPRANGEVERQNRSFLKAIRESHAEGKN